MAEFDITLSSYRPAQAATSLSAADFVGLRPGAILEATIASRINAASVLLTIALSPSQVKTENIHADTPPNGVAGSTPLPTSQSIARASVVGNFSPGSIPEKFLVPNQVLQLQVVNAKPIPTLRIITPPELASAITQRYLAINLPQQQALGPLLSRVAIAHTAASNSLPPAVSRIADASRQLFASLPQAADVTTASGLKQAASDSGIFLENKLRTGLTQDQALPNLASDLKANLFRLIAALQPLASGSAANGPDLGALEKILKQYLPQAHRGETEKTSAPPLPQHGVNAQSRSGVTSDALSSPLIFLKELLVHAEAATARITTNQLAHLPPDSSLQSLWTLEIPIRYQGHADILHMQVSRDAAQQQVDHLPQWTVNLALNLEELGPVHARLTIRGRKVNSRFSAVRGETVRKINDRLALLRGMFDQVGLEPEQLTCQQDTSPELVMSSPSGGGIVDERT